ncbi:MAG: cbb3-type cytochrome c oxidase subunit II [Fimbriimonadaceae bacterium]|nr:cbb3-type cytochrome c oxidase subunit II [Fimbriimonadaceae bacterium]
MLGKIDYRLPSAIMAVMLGAIIWLVVIYPALGYKLDRPEINPDLSGEVGDYKKRKDYTDLQWYGRRVYIEEGCFYCHSQQARYQDRGMGPTAIPQEFQFDGPHLLGSARTGPDLAREGGKYPSRWHREHHINPRSKSAGSIMPRFQHLDHQPLEFPDAPEIDSQALLRATPAELRKQYASDTDRQLTPAETMLELRAIGYSDYDVVKPDGRGVTRLDALVAYMQCLGPGRLYEPGGAVPWLEGVPHKPSSTYALGRDGAAPQALPAGLPAPTDWSGLGAKAAEYWVPSEYQDLAKKAHEDMKIPAFEPRFIVNGRGIYLEKCAPCHGLNGQGNGPAGRYMMKKPANFWLPQFKTYSDAMWFYRVAEGVPGTEMPVWKHSLRQRKKHQEWDQIWYLVTYLKYIAAASPLQPVPYDLPPEYYLADQDRARRGMFPVDAALVAQVQAELAKKAAQPAAPATPSTTAPAAAPPVAPPAAAAPSAPAAAH